MRPAAIFVILLFLASIARCPRDDAEAVVDAQMVNVSEPVAAVPWRLYMTCPVDHRNVPVLPARRMA